MNRIKVLPEEITYKIAAGEVIGGPYSVVKELAENSLDAGAGTIDIEIIEGGTKGISVTDDGTGIYRDDIPLAIKEHATSKIRNISDLDAIHTFGFRGEALSSIASVSQITILSRQRNEETGGKLVHSAGGTNLTDYAGPAGTKVIVENLFYNVPARKKFMKSKNAEMRALRDAVMHLALAVPEVSFTLTVDGKRQFNFTSAADHEERILQVLGKNLAEELTYSELTDLKVKIFGFVSKPAHMKSTRNRQYFMVNGRPVEYRYMGFHLTRAYEAAAPKGTHPVAVLYLEIDPSLTDVNIHPAKREIKLFDQRYVDSLVYGLGKKALNDCHEFSGGELVSYDEERYSFQGPDRRGPFAGRKPVPSIPVKERGDTALNEEGPVEKGTVFKDMIRESRAIYEEIYEGNTYRILGILFSTYVLAEQEEVLYIIDFHAAHERILYDGILAGGKLCEKQELMFPSVIELDPGAYRTALEHIELFDEIGYKVEDFSDNSIAVRSVPHLTVNVETEEAVIEIIQALEEERGDSSYLIKRAAAVVACHSARRAGDTLRGDEMNSLVEKVLDRKIELRCPHGRPFLFRMTKNEIERMFKRS